MKKITVLENCYQCRFLSEDTLSHCTYFEKPRDVDEFKDTIPEFCELPDATEDNKVQYYKVFFKYLKNRGVEYK